MSPGSRVGSISAALSGPAFLPEKMMSVGSFPEQRLVIEPSSRANDRKNNATRFTDWTNRSDKPRPISIPGSLSSAPAKKSVGRCQMCVPRSTDRPTTSPIKSRLKSVLGSVLPTSNAIRISSLKLAKF